MKFSGKVVLVTGAASGIGAEAARHFAKLGARVAMVDMNEKLLNEVADEISKSGGQKPLPIVADVTTDAQRILDETVKNFEKLDILINNAAILWDDNILDFDINQYDRVMNVNLRSVIVLTQLAIPHLEKTKGNVINVTSMAALAARNQYMSYALSKCALAHFTRNAAISLAPKGIRVNSIQPGSIKSMSFFK